MKPKEYKGVAYFPDFFSARDFGTKYCKGYPAWRVVEYGQGYAVQLRPSGDYLSTNGKPSMTNRMDAFFA